MATKVYIIFVIGSCSDTGEVPPRQRNRCTSSQRRRAPAAYANAGKPHARCKREPRQRASTPQLRMVCVRRALANRGHPLHRNAQGRAAIPPAQAIAELLHRPQVRRDHPDIAVLAGAEIARRLEIYESRHLFPVHQMRSSPPTRGRACSGGSSNRNTKRATRGDTPSSGSGRRTGSAPDKNRWLTRAAPIRATTVRGWLRRNT